MVCNQPDGITLVYSFDFCGLVPSGPPTRVSSTALTPNSILLSWALPLPEERNGDITGYIINVTNLVTGVIQQFTTAVVSNFTVPSLRPFTVYVTTIAARTAVGMGPFSGVVSIQTLETGIYDY